MEIARYCCFFTQERGASFPTKQITRLSFKLQITANVLKERVNEITLSFTGHALLYTLDFSSFVLCALATGITLQSVAILISGSDQQVITDDTEVQGRAQ